MDLAGSIQPFSLRSRHSSCIWENIFITSSARTLGLAHASLASSSFTRASSSAVVLSSASFAFSRAMMRSSSEYCSIQSFLYSKNGCRLAYCRKQLSTSEHSSSGLASLCGFLANIALWLVIGCTHWHELEVHEFEKHRRRRDRVPVVITEGERNSTIPVDRESQQLVSLLDDPRVEHTCMR